MFAARTIMTREPITVKEDTPIYEAMEILIDHQITGLPVVSGTGDLVGIVSEKDLLNLLYNPRGEGGTVGEVMTRNAVAFNEDDSLTDICEALLNNAFRRVPIVSHGRLVGVISRTDIIRFILRLRHAGKEKERT